MRNAVRNPQELVPFRYDGLKSVKGSDLKLMHRLYTLFQKMIVKNSNKLTSFVELANNSRVTGQKLCVSYLKQNK